MWRRSVSLTLLLLISLAANAEEREKHPPGEQLSATVDFKISSSSRFTTIVETESYAKKSKATHSRLAKLAPFSDTKVTATVQYNLQSRQLFGYDCNIIAFVGKKTAVQDLRFNEAATTNLPASGFVNPKNEYVEVLVYDNEAGEVFINVFTRKKP